MFVQVESLLGVIRTNTELEDQGRPVKELCLNKVFLGNPGTGKQRTLWGGTESPQGNPEGTAGGPDPLRRGPAARGSVLWRLF